VRTAFGATRIADMLAGDQLQRICRGTNWDCQCDPGGGGDQDAAAPRGARLVAKALEG